MPLLLMLTPPALMLGRLAPSKRLEPPPRDSLKLVTSEL
jgi:hypothetical protein